MEIKTSVGALIVVGFVSYTIGYWKAKIRAREEFQEKRISDLESLLKNF